MNYQDTAKKYNDYQIKMRRYFHRHPEESGKEYNTSKVIKEELTKLGVDFVDCGLETGVLATIKGAKPGKTILLRADIDALAVKETTGLEYASENEGVMHACGHDCHISMLLTAAHILKEHQNELAGTVKLAFQPAEETASGAKSMIEQGALDGVDGCFAFHVWSDVEAGKVCCMPGPMMASVDQFKIEVKGKGGHGAAPHQCVDAVVVAAAIVNNLQTVVSRETNPVDSLVVTVGKVEAGTRWNVVAENAVLEGTVRAFTDETWERVPKAFERVVKNTAASFGATAEIKYDRLIMSTVNHEDFSKLVGESSKKVLGEDSMITSLPSMGGEDFGIFLKHVPGAVAWLGVGNEACGAIWPQHSGNYQVDENALVKGAMIYAQVAMDFNSK